MNIIETYRNYAIRESNYYDDYGAWFQYCPYVFYHERMNDDPESLSWTYGWAATIDACKKLIDNTTDEEMLLLPQWTETILNDRRLHLLMPLLISGNTILIATYFGSEKLQGLLHPVILIDDIGDRFGNAARNAAKAMKELTATLNDMKPPPHERQRKKKFYKTNKFF